MTDEEIDKLLVALSQEGFGMPTHVDVRDYFPDGMAQSEREAAWAAVKAADAQAWEDNRAALREALRAALEA